MLRVVFHFLREHFGEFVIYVHHHSNGNVVFGDKRQFTFLTKQNHDTYKSKNRRNYLQRAQKYVHDPAFSTLFVASHSFKERQHSSCTLKLSEHFLMQQQCRYESETCVHGLKGLHPREVKVFVHEVEVHQDLDQEG